MALSKQVTVSFPEGLHARPAAQVVKLASSFSSDIRMAVNGKTVNLKSIVSVMAAGVKANQVIELHADGADEGNAVDALVQFLEAGGK